MPTFRIERECQGIVAGIDEAGRGPLAGPVTAAAVIVRDLSIPRRLARMIDDSKKLTAEEREEVFARLHDCASVTISIGMASVEEIDRVNILQATFIAMQRAVSGLPAAPDLALVDGNQVPRQLGCAVRTVIGGDARSLSIAAASIIAKVTRDRLMRELAGDHPVYGWERNAGYGTPEHRAAIDQYGPSQHHRMSFMPMPLFAVAAGHRRD
ncbi:MAG: ribonuclease HII [Reyranellaceae bacterium]